MTDRYEKYSSSPWYTFNHRVKYKVDLQSLFGLHVHSCTHWLHETRNSPRIWAHIRGHYWSANINDISLWSPACNVLYLLLRATPLYGSLPLVFILMGTPYSWAKTNKKACYKSQPAKISHTFLLRTLTIRYLWKILFVTEYFILTNTFNKYSGTLEFMLLKFRFYMYKGHNKEN